MKILVTGATGFIGQHLVPVLAKTHQVVALTRSKQQVFSNVEWVVSDFCGDFDFSSLPACDGVIHLAQSEYYREFPERANDIFNVNVASTQMLLDYAAKCGCKHFIIASTGSVYEPYLGGLSESDVISPTSYYSRSKWASEVLAGSYLSQFSVASLRLFFPYGSGQKDKLIPTLIERIRKNDSIDLYGPEEGMVITPTHINDVIQAFEMALMDAWSGTVNIASNEVLSLRKITNVLAEKMNVLPQYRIQEGTPFNIIPDVSQFITLRGNDSFIPFEKGIDDLVNG